MEKIDIIIAELNSVIKEHQLTYRDLGRILELDHSRIYRALNGYNAKPDFQTLVKLAKLFNRNDLVFAILALM